MPEPTANRHLKGKQSEDLAARFLEQRGMKVVARNARCALGELDLVVRDGKIIVFVEVKSRFGATYGTPQESITPVKQRKLTRLAQWYLKQHRLEGQPARFDVVAVTWRGEESELTWIANAFKARE